jgi:hypothetical protein
MHHLHSIRVLGWQNSICLEARGWGREGGGGGKGGVMTQTLYAHTNKGNFKKLN